MSALRISNPVWLEKLTCFSDDRTTLSPMETMRRLRAQRWATDALEQATTVNKGYGRKRKQGRWIWAYVAFVASKAYVDVEPWWSASNDTRLWEELGFPRRREAETGHWTQRPSYQNVQRRFAELEKFSGHVQEAAGRFIRRAIQHDPRILHHVHVDSTEAETHAALVHDCPETAKCMQHSRRKRSPVAKRPGRVPTLDQRAVRQKLAELPTDDELATRHEDGEWDALEELPGGRVRVRSGAHWYRTLDPTAGRRAYTSNGKLIKFWHGYYVQQAVSHLYGAPLAVVVTSASRVEFKIYMEDTFPALEANTGGRPQTMTFDKGFVWAELFEYNTRRRVASVGPFRKRSGAEEPQDAITHDRHGVVRCQHCGGPTQLIREAAEPYPRLWVRCTSAVKGAPRTAGCDRVQTIACSTDWRTLTRLPQTDERYQELSASHSMYERIHRLWRERWKVGGNDLASRPKRMGVECQNLRAQTALLIEWMLICSREGFLTGRAERRQRRAEESLGKEATAEKLTKLAKERKEAGLDHPYGPAAVHLRIKGASIKTPSEIVKDARETAKRRKNERAQRKGKSGAPPPGS